MPDKQTLAAILKYAIIKEAAARETYARAADKARDSSGRRALMGMAQVEAEHEAALRKLAGAEISRSMLLGSDEVPIAEFIEDKGVDPDWDLRAVLAYASSREQKSKQLYEAMAERCQNPDARDLLRKLAQDEQEHERALDDMLEGQTGVWTLE